MNGRLACVSCRPPETTKKFVGPSGFHPFRSCREYLLFLPFPSFPGTVDSLIRHTLHNPHPLINHTPGLVWVIQGMCSERVDSTMYPLSTLAPGIPHTVTLIPCPGAKSTYPARARVHPLKALTCPTLNLTQPPIPRSHDVERNPVFRPSRVSPLITMGEHVFHCDRRVSVSLTGSARKNQIQEVYPIYRKTEAFKLVCGPCPGRSPS
ncbi:hypothetical protein OG21DRAFT_92336 [Imleria badia]|nr:hypothetical protein OG21DRAFT_92336 [Imleria badia]